MVGRFQYPLFRTEKMLKILRPDFTCGEVQSCSGISSRATQIENLMHGRTGDFIKHPKIRLDFQLAAFTPFLGVRDK
jgi:hypothetical protein